MARVETKIVFFTTLDYNRMPFTSSNYKLRKLVVVKMFLHLFLAKQVKPIPRTGNFWAQKKIIS